jgi:hypothetical protein
MLAALALSGDGGLTETRMASAAGYKSKVSANRAFAAAGLLIATYLAVDASSEMPEDESDGASLLGFRGIRRTDDVPGSRILHPELREALTVAEV